MRSLIKINIVLSRGRTITFLGEEDGDWATFKKIPPRQKLLKKKGASEAEVKKIKQALQLLRSCAIAPSKKAMNNIPKV